MQHLAARPCLSLWKRGLPKATRQPRWTLNHNLCSFYPAFTRLCSPKTGNFTLVLPSYHLNGATFAPILPHFYPNFHPRVPWFHPDVEGKTCHLYLIFTLVLPRYYTTAALYFTLFLISYWSHIFPYRFLHFYLVLVYNVKGKIPHLPQSYPSPSLSAPPSVLPQCWYFMRPFQPNFNPRIKRIYFY